jgi:hypothetical protein
MPYLPEYKKTFPHTLHFSEKYRHRTCLPLCAFIWLLAFAADEFEK